MTDNERKILKLAAVLLDEYAESRSNAICNDPSPEAESAIQEIENFQGMANKWNGGECEDADSYDWIVSHTIANELKRMAE